MPAVPDPGLPPMVPSLPQRGLLALVRGYRLLLKPWLGNACRFEPTCSAYALQALQQHGAGAGTYLAARRVLRCNPMCSGGCDPVPATAPALFTRFTSRFSAKTRP
ncbi:hypothetical protein BurJ1DRAFT_5021 [Burkholderiales bacterium JOSHI_001]|nr:hypothetical protein BurJ1DRAFT_5021 [Burkholderiales bacterium JOSHI_001]